MKMPLTLDQICDLDNAKPIVMDILMKGIVCMFFDPLERQKLVQSVSATIKNVPFVPTPVIEGIIESAIGFAAEFIKQALDATCDQCVTGTRDQTSFSPEQREAYRLVCHAEAVLMQRQTAVQDVRRHVEDEDVEMATSADHVDVSDEPFGVLLRRNLAAILVLHLPSLTPLTGNGKAWVAVNFVNALLESCEFRKFDAFTKLSTLRLLQTDRAILKRSD